MTVRYLNIGDPVAFGFKTPPHIVEAAVKAMRDGHNGYLASAGIAPAREAVAADYQQRGVAVSPDRVLITTGTSEGIELALNALVNEGEEVLVPLPTYPLYTAVLAKIGAIPRYYRTDPRRDWLPDLESLRSLVTDRTRVLVVIDPNNPTGAVYPAPVRRALIDFAERHDLTIRRRRGLRRPRLRRLGAAARHARTGGADHLALEPVQGVPRAGLARGMAGRRRDAAARRCAGSDEEARRRPAVQPRTDAVRDRRGAHRRPIAPGWRSARRSPSARALTRTC